MDKKPKKKQEQETGPNNLPIIDLESCETFDPSGNQTLSDEESTEEEFDLE